MQEVPRPSRDFSAPQPPAAREMPPCICTQKQAEKGEAASERPVTAEAFA